MERERLAVPGLQFLGVESADFDGPDGVIKLTEQDRRRVEGMLCKEWVLGDEPVL